MKERGWQSRRGAGQCRSLNKNSRDQNAVVRLGDLPSSTPAGGSVTQAPSKLPVTVLDKGDNASPSPQVQKVHRLTVFSCQKGRVRSPVLELTWMLNGNVSLAAPPCPLCYRTATPCDRYSKYLLITIICRRCIWHSDY